MNLSIVIDPPTKLIKDNETEERACDSLANSYLRSNIKLSLKEDN